MPELFPASMGQWVTGLGAARRDCRSPSTEPAGPCRSVGRPGTAVSAGRLRPSWCRGGRSRRVTRSSRQCKSSGEANGRTFDVDSDAAPIDRDDGGPDDLAVCADVQPIDDQPRSVVRPAAATAVGDAVRVSVDGDVAGAVGCTRRASATTPCRAFGSKAAYAIRVPSGDHAATWTSAVADARDDRPDIAGGGVERVEAAGAPPRARSPDEHDLGSVRAILRWFVIQRRADIEEHRRAAAVARHDHDRGSRLASGQRDDRAAVGREAPRAEAG